MSENSFPELLQRGEGHGLQTDDVLAAVLPLFRQVAAMHEEQRVAPLEGLSALTVNEEGGLALNAASLPPSSNLGRIEKLQRPVVSALHVIGRARVTSDDQTGIQYSNLEVSDGEAELNTCKVPDPAYMGFAQKVENSRRI